MFIMNRIGTSIIVSAIFISVTAQTAFAVDCTPVVVQAVQSGNAGKVVVKFNNSWHVISNGSNVARSDRLSLVLAALLSGRQVFVRYSGSSYNCSADEYNTEPTDVRLLADIF